MLGKIAGKADEHQKPLTLCGEMAGVPLEALALVGLGYRSISMAPSSIGPVKAMIRSLNAAEVKDKLQELLSQDDCDIRANLRSFATEKNIEI